MECKTQEFLFTDHAIRLLGDASTTVLGRGHLKQETGEGAGVGVVEGEREGEGGELGVGEGAMHR